MVACTHNKSEIAYQDKSRLSGFTLSCNLPHGDMDGAQLPRYVHSPLAFLGRHA
jgi:hypothetical protein